MWYVDTWLDTSDNKSYILDEVFRWEPIESWALSKQLILMYLDNKIIFTLIAGWMWTDNWNVIIRIIRGIIPK